MNILVTGGAGYVGSHIVKKLVEDNYKVVVYDNLSQGNQKAVNKKAILIKSNLKDKIKINEVLKKYKIKAIIHTAAYVSVGESIKNPKKYFTNNVDYSMNLLNAMKSNNVKFIVFSSTLSTINNMAKRPFTKNLITIPENPYTKTKFIFENTLREADKSDNIKSISLKCSNVAGADHKGAIGEYHKPETHLIPNVLKAALGKKSYVNVYGKDYKTKDGTSVRDYIHVSDVADSHILALEALFNGHKTDIYNLGNGKGYSVLDIIKVAEKVTGKKIQIKIKGKRLGDAPIVVADSKKIRKDLKWKQVYNDIDNIIKTAWNFHKKHPNGFIK